MLAFGRGLCSLSTSSFVLNYYFFLKLNMSEYVTRHILRFFYIPDFRRFSFSLTTSSSFFGVLDRSVISCGPPGQIQLCRQHVISWGFMKTFTGVFSKIHGNFLDHTRSRIPLLYQCKLVHVVVVVVVDF